MTDEASEIPSLKVSNPREYPMFKFKKTLIVGRPRERRLFGIWCLGFGASEAAGEISP